MNESFKPTHRTRPGVEVIASRTNAGNMIANLCISCGNGPCCTEEEFAALFEPIPRRKMVEISLELAKEIAADEHGTGGVCQLLAAIRAAEEDNAQ